MNFKKFRKFRKNAKALSPVIATIILIAVTVAVSVVVAAWMGALTIGFMGNAEQASITNTSFTSDTIVVLTVQNTGSGKVTISGASVDGTPIAATGIVGDPSLVIAKGGSATVTITVPDANAFVSTAQYTISLQTAKGNSLTTQASYTGP